MGSCAATGKVRYPSSESARDIQNHLAYGDKVEPYRCPDCEGWHLGGHHRPSRHRGNNPRDPLSNVTGYEKGAR